jgi:SPP1 gp7 family putative phage head morphogenesis protein
MKTLSEAMREVRAQAARDEGKILDAILHSSSDHIANLLTVEPWLSAQPKIQDELFDELISSGQRTRLPTIEKAKVSFSFDADREEASRWAEKEAGLLIVEIVDQQRNVVRDYVARSELGEFTPQQVARGLRDTIGLTEQQAGWVENFRERQIADRMADGISRQQAYADSERATERYHDRIHRYRTETIARTEILRANTEGRKEAWQQGIEEGFIDPSWRKQWQTGQDERVCDICAPLDGETAPVMGDFPGGDPPAHPNCRCTLNLVPEEEPTDFNNLTDDELQALLDDLIDEEPLDDLLPSEDLSIDERIAQLTAERQPIVAALLEHDYGREILSPENYQALIEQQKPMWEELQALKQQKLEAERAPSIRPTEDGVSTYERIADIEYSDEQKAAFQEWTGDGYRRVQGALYGEGSLRGIDPEVRSVIDNLDSAMEPIPRGTPLYRGQTQGLENLAIGSTYSTGSYVSTTTDPVTAGAFSKSAGQVAGELREGDTPTIMRISTSRARGAVVPNSSEYEVVLARKTEMRVVGITQEQIQGISFRIIEMEA